MEFAAGVGPCAAEPYAAAAAVVVVAAVVAAAAAAAAAVAVDVEVADWPWRATLVCSEGLSDSCPSRFRLAGCEAAMMSNCWIRS